MPFGNKRVYRYLSVYSLEWAIDQNLVDIEANWKHGRSTKKITLVAGHLVKVTHGQNKCRNEPWMIRAFRIMGAASKKGYDPVVPLVATHGGAGCWFACRADESWFVELVMVCNWELDPKDWLLDYDQKWVVPAERIYWCDQPDPPEELQVRLTNGEADTNNGGLDIEW